MDEVAEEKAGGAADLAAETAKKLFIAVISDGYAI